MSVEAALEGWEGMQRQGQDILDFLGSLGQGLRCMLQSQMRVLGIPVQQPSWQFTAAHVLDLGKGSSPEFDPPFPWPWMNWQETRAQPRCNRVKFNSKRRDVSVGGRVVEEEASTSQDAVGIHELGQRLGQAGANLGACVSDIARHFVQHLSRPFQVDSGFLPLQLPTEPRQPLTSPLDFQVADMELAELDECRTSDKKGSVLNEVGWKVHENGEHRNEKEMPESEEESDEVPDAFNEELFAFLTKSYAQFQKQVSLSVTTTFHSRTQDFESSVAARGDLWRAEASHTANVSARESPPFFLLQIGPVLFVRDTTLLLPVHLSKQHLLWYGFDRKNGLHSLCPAVWSKHRRWLLMSMICINPITCTFMDLQFPYGQFTYVAGEGLTTSAFLPAFGGLLQVQSQYPGDTKLSFSHKTKWGMHITPSVQLPENSFSFGVVHPLAWQRSGLLVRPTAQLSVTPVLGGRNAGWRAEMVHSPREKLSWTIGCALTIQPSVSASLCLGRCKQNGLLGNSGLVLQVDTPLENINRTSFSIQLNGGIDF